VEGDKESIANVVKKGDSNYVRLLLTKTPKFHTDQQYETKWEKFSKNIAETLS
jgi:hypothetical protein